ncbi:hypothetical protein [Neisseria iguanae]|uniref:hypothetical protein n=1 Tax=Neisseria iguanae TaxID=90242 RepID=UPI0011B1F7AA|nr:hypothetical protein [Neisseria iguanae]
MFCDRKTLAKRIKIRFRRYFQYDHQVKRSGLMGSGGIGFTIGSRSKTLEQAQDNVSHSASTVGSLYGDTTLIAGKDYTQSASVLSSPQGNTTVNAQRITAALSAAAGRRCSMPPMTSPSAVAR